MNRLAIAVGAGIIVAQVAMWRAVCSLRAEVESLDAQVHEHLTATTSPSPRYVPAPLPERASGAAEATTGTPAWPKLPAAASEEARAVDERLDEASDTALLASAKRAADPDEALHYYDAFLKRFPDSAETRTAIHGAMRAAVAAQDWSLTDSYAQQLAKQGDLSRRDQADVLFFRALASQQQGDLANARVLYDRAAEVGRGLYVEGNVYLILGRMYAPNDVALARQYFSKLIETFDGTHVADDLVALAARDRAELP